MTDLQNTATFADDALSVSVGSFSLSLTVKEIDRNWDALSQFPERRARIELGALSERLNAFSAHLGAIVARGGALDVTAEAERFTVRHVSLTRRAWAMDSRCMSWFVVGPARFPVNRSGGYTVSPSAAARFERLYADGWDASFFTGELIPPSQAAV